MNGLQQNTNITKRGQVQEIVNIRWWRSIISCVVHNSPPLCKCLHFALWNKIQKKMETKTNQNKYFDWNFLSYFFVQPKWTKWRHYLSELLTNSETYINRRFHSNGIHTFHYIRVNQWIDSETFDSALVHRVHTKMNSTNLLILSVTILVCWVGCYEAGPVKHLTHEMELSNNCRDLCSHCGCAGFYCGDECICDCNKDDIGNCWIRSAGHFQLV